MFSLLIPPDNGTKGDLNTGAGSSVHEEIAKHVEDSNSSSRVKLTNALKTDEKIREMEAGLSDTTQYAPRLSNTIVSEFPSPQGPKGRPRATSAAPYLSPGPVRQRKKIEGGDRGGANIVENDVQENRHPNSTMEVSRLPRGGIYVETSAGALLIGSPSGTLKDLLSLELPIPKLCIVPLDTFSRHLGNHLGLSLAEFELIALHRRYTGETSPLTLLCVSASRANDIQNVFKESLFCSTTDKALVANDFAAKGFQLEPAIMSSEISFLLPCLSSGLHMEFDKIENQSSILKGFIDVKYFSEDRDDGIFTWCNEGGVLEVTREEGHGGAFRLKEKQGGEAVIGGKMSVSEVIKLPDKLPFTVKQFLITPPLFGVTILGNSNGFDPHSLSTGYIIWINRRGILVNPPVYCAARLEIEMGIHPSMIHNIILTTTHGDFDQGGFQKILQEERVIIHSTKTVYDKFIRKYAALSGLRPKFLRAASKFRQVRVGTPLKIRGANFEFFYNVDSVLSLGFTVEVEGKTLLFTGGYTLSGETTTAMQRAGAISSARKEFVDNLVRRDFDKVFYDLPLGNKEQTRRLLDSMVSNSSEAFRQSLLINHCLCSLFPDEINRGPDGTGIDSTISFEVPTSLYANARNLIETVEDTTFFKGLSVELAGSLVQVSETKTVKAGNVLAEVGEICQGLSMIVSGSVSVDEGNDSISSNNHWVTGDSFGEEAIIGGVSTVKAVAATDVELIQISKLDLEWILSGTQVRERVKKVHDMRLASLSLEKVLCRNSVLNCMTRSQKLAFESNATVEHVGAGDCVWTRGDKSAFALILIQGRMIFPDAVAKLMHGLVKKSGTMMIKQEDTRHNYCPEVFVEGAWLGNATKLIDESGTQTNTLKAISDCSYFRFSAKDVISLLEANPGFFVSIGSSEFVI